MGQTQQGFSGELPQVHLADVMQLHHQNQFSGGLSILHNKNKGVIFFREGEIVHAEQNQTTGIDAIYQMLSWTGGIFSCHPNLKPMHTSIRMSMTQLLLECHCRLDEEGVYQPQPKTDEKQSMNKTVRKILPIPGVNFAVLIDSKGQPDSDNSDSAARLGAQGHYFIDVTDKLGRLLGAKNCHFSAITGNAGHCLVFKTKQRSLVVGVPGNCNFQPVESAIRTTLK